MIIMRSQPVVCVFLSCRSRTNQSSWRSTENYAIRHCSYLNVRQLGQPGACVLQWYVETHGVHLGAS